jgi:N6-adenosine-specific RNA methylase IME4
MTDLLARTKTLIAEGAKDTTVANDLRVTRHQARKLIDRAKTEMALAGEIQKPDPVTAAEFAERITACWRQSYASVIEAGSWLIKAKAKLEHGEFGKLFEDGTLPFRQHTAQRLMAIANDERLSNPAHVQHLPPHWGTLYELTKLDDAAFDARIADGTIQPDMERKAITTIAKKERRAEREKESGEKQRALPQRKFGLILSDCEWRYLTWSDKGLDRAADNHYSTSDIETLAARDVASIAADDCVLLFWATAPMLHHALDIVKRWGFEYKTHAIWDKEVQTTGYWFRSVHEILIIAVRGKPVAPAMGDQWPSIIVSRKGEHSEKPSWQYEWIDQFFPTVPKIELNARANNPPPAGWETWETWGHEAPQTEAAE